MGKFIEEFYYGNIDPQARSTFGREQEKNSRLCICVERGKWRIQPRQFYDGVSLGSILYIRYLCCNRYPVSRLAEGVTNMRDKKYYIALDDFERRVVVNCLNEMRNKLIANGKYTDAVDEVLLKIIDAKQKKFKVIYKEA